MTTLGNEHSPDTAQAPEDQRHRTELDSRTAEALPECLDQLRVRNAQLQEALHSRVVIEQAKGVLAERYRLGFDDAFAILRQAARSHRMRIHRLAATVLPAGATPVEIKRALTAPRYRGTIEQDDLVGSPAMNQFAALRAAPVAEKRQQGATTIVVLAGELDLYTADIVRGAVFGACDHALGGLVIELSTVEFADSTTIGILLEARARRHPRFIALAGPQPQVRRTIGLCGLDGTFPIYPTLAAALSHSPRDFIETAQSNGRPNAQEQPTTEARDERSLSSDPDASAC